MNIALLVLAAVHARIVEQRDRGATATEYAMLVGFIAAVIVAVVAVFGTQLGEAFGALGDFVAGF